MFTDKYFGPLDQSNCAYFYFFSVLGFLLMLIALLSTLGYLVSSYKKIHYGILVSLFFSCISYFMIYYQSRLLHTMCVKVL